MRLQRISDWLGIGIGGRRKNEELSTGDGSEGQLQGTVAHFTLDSKPTVRLLFCAEVECTMPVLTEKDFLDKLEVCDSLSRMRYYLMSQRNYRKQKEVIWRSLDEAVEIIQQAADRITFAMHSPTDEHLAACSSCMMAHDKE